MAKRQNQPMNSPISYWVNVARLPQKGMPVEFNATEEQRAALARDHGLLELRSLIVEMLVARWKRNGVRVTGQVKAKIVQECVVSLDPIDNLVDERFEQLYLPHDSKLGRLGFEGGGEILLDAEGEDSPEVFEGDSIDVGALAEQFFGMGIDPYPRKPSAMLEAGVAGAAEQSDSPGQNDDWRRKLGDLLPKG